MQMKTMFAVVDKLVINDQLPRNPAKNHWCYNGYGLRVLISLKPRCPLELHSFCTLTDKLL